MAKPYQAGSGQENLAALMHNAVCTDALLVELSFRWHYIVSQCICTCVLPALEETHTPNAQHGVPSVSQHHARQKPARCSIYKLYTHKAGSIK